MSQRAILDRKISDLRNAVRQLQDMHGRQLRLKASAADFYDPLVHHCALAQATQSAYTRQEVLLKDLLALNGESVDDSAAWHRDSLLHCTLDLGEERPPLIDEDDRRDLLGLLAFRHAVRNAYVHELRIDDVIRHAESAAETLPRVLARREVFVNAFFVPRP